MIFGLLVLGEICPKTKSYPPFIKQKLILTPSHIMIILRLPPPPSPWKKSPPIDSLVPSLLVVGFLPPVQISLQMTLRRMSKSPLKSHQNHWTLSLCRLRMNWEIPHLLQRSLALRFPRAWVRTRSINSALLPLILRPFCFRNILSSLLVGAFTSFSIVQEISSRVFWSSI